MKQLITQLLGVIQLVEKQSDEFKSQLGRYGEKFDADIQEKVDTRKKIIQAIIRILEKTPTIIEGEEECTCQCNCECDCNE